MAKSLVSKIDEEMENILRPKYLTDFVGQTRDVKNLMVFISAAKKRNEPLDHVLLCGAPGLGKTSLAQVIANEMGGKLRTINGPSIERQGDIAHILSLLEPGEILFIDEIHGLPKNVEEIMYSAMEDFSLKVVVPRDDGVNTLEVTLPPFTIIGSTTKVNLLSSPFKMRFGIQMTMKFYKVEELKEIVIRSAKILGIATHDSAALEIAKRARGTPRIANNLLKRVRDFANDKNKDIISKQIVDYGLEQLNIDSAGLDSTDVSYLRVLVERYKGRPVGLETIASTIGDNAKNLEEVIEPYLLSIGFIERTIRGRVVTEEGRKHFVELYSIK